MKPTSVKSLITFLYFSELAEGITFFEEMLGLSPVETQDFARIYPFTDKAYIGIVAGASGFLQPQAENAVLITLVVDDVCSWYDYLQERGVVLLTEVKHNPSINIRCFFFEGPGGYKFEVQEFLSPIARRIFHEEA